MLAYYKQKFNLCQLILPTWEYAESFNIKCEGIYLCIFSFCGDRCLVALPPLIQRDIPLEINLHADKGKGRSSMAEVQLFKKQSKYKDKQGKDKVATNFFAKCGSMLVPIEVVYFPDKDNDDKDKLYVARKMVLESYAEVLPDKAKDEQ